MKSVEESPKKIFQRNPYYLCSLFFSKKSLLGFSCFFLKEIHALEIFESEFQNSKITRECISLRKKQLKPSKDFFEKKDYKVVRISLEYFSGDSSTLFVTEPF